MGQVPEHLSNKFSTHATPPHSLFLHKSGYFIFVNQKNTVLDLLSTLVFQPISVFSFGMFYFGISYKYTTTSSHILFNQDFLQFLEADKTRDFNLKVPVEKNKTFGNKFTCQICRYCLNKLHHAFKFRTQTLNMQSAKLQVLSSCHLQMGTISITFQHNILFISFTLLSLNSYIICLLAYDLSSEPSLAMIPALPVIIPRPEVVTAAYWVDRCSRDFATGMTK